MTDDGATGATPDPSDLLAVAERAARSAGGLLLERRPADLGVAGTKSSPTDVVTEMDLAAQREVLAVVRAARPDDGVLGEEGEDDPGSTGVRWVVDPLDGTVNYLYGVPAWAVSVAAEVGGAVVAGAVVVPALGEVFTAVRGRGAALDGRPLPVRTGPPPLERALVATGFGYAAARRAAQARTLARVLPQVRDVRRAGAAAVDLCWAAAGRVDAYYERGTHLWDVAAGGLVAEECGLRVAGLRGRPAGEDLVLAAPPGLFEPLHDLLVLAGADRDDAGADLVG